MKVIVTLIVYVLVIAGMLKIGETTVWLLVSTGVVENGISVAWIGAAVLVLAVAAHAADLDTLRITIETGKEERQ